MQAGKVRIPFRAIKGDEKAEPPRMRGSLSRRGKVECRVIGQEEQGRLYEAYLESLFPATCSYYGTRPGYRTGRRGKKLRSIYEVAKAQGIKEEF